MADWASLPDEILCIIYCKRVVDTVIDRLQFSAVCKSWRFVASCTDPLPLPLPQQQPPWLMLPPQTKINDTCTSFRYSFVGLADGGKGFENKLYEIDLIPQLVLHAYPCVGSAGNWFVLVDMKKSSGKKKYTNKYEEVEKHRVCIFNPFSKRKLNLPPQLTFSNQFSSRPAIIEKVVLTSISCSNNSIIDCIAVAIYGEGYIALARPGDISWTRSPDTFGIRNSTIRDVIVFKNQLYAIDSYGSLFIFNIDKDSLEATQVFRHDDRRLEIDFTGTSYYLVEWMGELLLIGRRRYDEKGFKVAKQSFNAAYEWKWIEDLGKHSLFLGFNSTSVAVSASECSSFKMNCIYHQPPRWRSEVGRTPLNTEVFDLTEKSHKHLCTEITMVDPPIWIVPNSIRYQS